MQGATHFVCDIILWPTVLPCGTQKIFTASLHRLAKVTVDL